MPFSEDGNEGVSGGGEDLENRQQWRPRICFIGVYVSCVPPHPFLNSPRILLYSRSSES